MVRAPMKPGQLTSTGKTLQDQFLKEEVIGQSSRKLIRVARCEEGFDS